MSTYNSLDESLYSFERKNISKNTIKHNKISKWKERNNLNDKEFVERLKAYGFNSEKEFNNILKYGSNNYKSKNEIKGLIDNFCRKENNYEFVTGLGEFLLPFLNYYNYKMNTILEKYNHTYLNKEYLLRNLTKTLYYYLKNISDKTIVLEFQMKLNETGKPLMKYFKENYLKTKNYHKYLLNKYPVLYRCIYEILEQDLNNTQQFLKRLSNDLKEIQSEFMEEQNLKLVNIIKGAGDKHNKGQSVIICDFEQNNRIIYKPRSLKIDTIFSHLTSLLNKNDKIIYKLNDIKTISKEYYGWQENIQNKDCKNENEVNQCYYRLGLLICLMHVFKTNDMHYENIIISGKNPYIIDLETFITNNSLRTTDTSNPLVKVYNSIFKTGMLPTGKLLPSYIDNDISGLTSTPNQKSKSIKHWYTIDDDTDEVRFEHKEFVTSGENHLVKLQNRIMNPYVYLKYILNGFEDMYHCILEGKNEIITFLNSNLNDCYGRSIFRSTYIYGKFLTTSYHPNYLSNGVDREYLFELLWNKFKEDKKYKLVIKQEIKSLLHNDIPYCSFNTTSRSLFINNIEIPNFFKETAINIIKNQIYEMNINDLKLQKRFIYNALNDFEMKKYNFNYIEEKLSSSNLNVSKQNLPVFIANTIIQNNYLSSIDNTSGIWMGSELSMDDNNYRLSLLDFSLYSGVCGILIFLAEIYKKTKQDYYLKVCKNSLNYIINNSDKLDVSSSMYNGIGSISYTCFYLYQITGDKYYKIYGKKYFEDMVDKIQNSEFESLAIDLLDGLSGNIIFCLELYRIYKDKKYLDIARNFTVLLKEKLKSKIKSNNSELLTGLGHGVSGISLALHKVSKYYPEFKNDVESVIEYEDKNFIERFLNWKDLRSNISTENKNINYWCHGRPGILLARSIIYKNKSLPLSKEINYENIVNLAYKQTKSMKRICLCHGIFGNLEMFKIISKCFSNSYSINDISQFKEELLSNNTTIPRIIKSLLNNNLVGLMTGVSGVGLSLLQDKKNIINPLLLKLPCPGEL